jgi:hypothetical protein
VSDEATKSSAASSIAGKKPRASTGVPFTMPRPASRPPTWTSNAFGSGGVGPPAGQLKADSSR